MARMSADDLNKLEKDRDKYIYNSEEMIARNLQIYEEQRYIVDVSHLVLSSEKKEEDCLFTKLKNKLQKIWDGK